MPLLISVLALFPLAILVPPLAARVPLIFSSSHAPLQVPQRSLPFPLPRLSVLVHVRPPTFPVPCSHCRALLHLRPSLARALASSLALLGFISRAPWPPSSLGGGRFTLSNNYYIKVAILGDYTSLSTQRSYLKFECQKHLSFFYTFPLGAFLQYIIFFPQICVIFLSFSQIDLQVVKRYLKLKWLNNREKSRLSRLFWARTQKISVRVRTKRSRIFGESMELWETL